MLQKPVFALPGCQRMSVNTLLCDTLGLADNYPFCFADRILVPAGLGLMDGWMSASKCWSLLGFEGF